MLETIFLIILSLISGTFTGFTGVSSAGIFVLAILDWLPIIKDFKTVIGTVLYILTFPTHIFAVWEFYKRGKIDFTTGNIVIICLLVGSFIGSKILLNSKLKVDEKSVKYLTAFFSFLVAIYFFISAYNL